MKFYVPYAVKYLRTIATRTFPNNVMERCKLSKLEVVLGAPESVTIPCPMHGTRPCQFDVEMTSDWHGSNSI